MFQYLYEWIQDMSVYLILITAVFYALPDSSYKKYVRFFTGIVLIFIMAAPVLKILGADTQVMNFYKSREYEKKIEEMEKAAQYLEGSGDEKGAEGIGDIEVGEIQIDEDR